MNKINIDLKLLGYISNIKKDINTLQINNFEIPKLKIFLKNIDKVVNYYLKKNGSYYFTESDENILSLLNMYISTNKENRMSLLNIYSDLSGNKILNEFVNKLYYALSKAVDFRFTIENNNKGSLVSRNTPQYFKKNTLKYISLDISLELSSSSKIRHLNNLVLNSLVNEYDGLLHLDGTDSTLYTPSIDYFLQSIDDKDIDYPAIIFYYKNKILEIDLSIYVEKLDINFIILQHPKFSIKTTKENLLKDYTLAVMLHNKYNSLGVKKLKNELVISIKCNMEYGIFD